MLVQNRMMKNPETISPEEFLASGLAKMHVRTTDRDRLVDARQAKGYTVLGVHV